MRASYRRGRRGAGSRRLGSAGWAEPGSTGSRVIFGTTITNIHGNGHTVTYDPSLSATPALGGKTYSLAGGGQLVPRS
jgi:hypothetical protein